MWQLRLNAAQPFLDSEAYPDQVKEMVSFFDTLSSAVSSNVVLDH